MALRTWFRYCRPVRWWISWRYRAEWGRRRGRSGLWLVELWMGREGLEKIIKELAKPNPFLAHAKWRRE